MKSEYKIQFRVAGQKWPAWWRTGVGEVFRSAGAAEAWLRKRENQIGGDQMWGLGGRGRPIGVRIVEVRVAREFEMARNGRGGYERVG